jgi:hypothetical protein
MKLKNLGKAINRRANGVTKDISKEVRSQGRAITNTGEGLRHDAKQAYVSGVNRGKSAVGTAKLVAKIVKSDGKQAITNRVNKARRDTKANISKVRAMGKVKVAKARATVKVQARPYRPKAVGRKIGNITF